MRACQVCGAELNPKQLKFCSRKCKSDNARADRPKCKRCGRPAANLNAKYCSRDCFFADKFGAKPGTCNNCGGESPTDEVFCSKECQRAAHKERNAKWRAKRGMGPESVIDRWDGIYRKLGADESEVDPSDPYGLRNVSSW